MNHFVMNLTNGDKISFWWAPGSDLVNYRYWFAEVDSMPSVKGWDSKVFASNMQRNRFDSVKEWAKAAFCFESIA